MLSLPTLRNIIFRKPNKVRDTAAEYTIIYKELDQETDIDELYRELQTVPIRDTPRIRFDFHSHTKDIFRNSEEDCFKSIIDSIKDLISDECTYDIFIEINKSVSEDGKLSVYDYSSFQKWFLDNSIKESIQFVNEIIINSNYGMREWHFLNDSNRSITFDTPLSTEGSVNSYRKTRESILNQSHRHTQIMGFERLEVLPQDFAINNNCNIDEEILDRLSLIQSLLSLAYISNRASFNDDDLDYEFWETPIRFGNCSISERDDLCNSKIYELYRWIYSSGEISDKFKITRKMICLLSENQDILPIKKETNEAIHNSYDLFIEKDVEAYLNALSTLAESINLYCDHVADSVTSLTNDFRKSLTAILGVVATVVLVKLIENSSSIGVLDEWMTVILFFALTIAFIFGLISLGMCLSRINFYKKMVKELKESYIGIFDKEQLEAEINGRQQYAEAVKYSKRWMVSLLVIWLGLFGTLFVALNCVSGYEILPLLFGLFAVN